MEVKKRMINVLWIDDNPEQFEEFLDDAEDEGLHITVSKTVESGLKELEDRNKIYEAIILDANCMISDEIREVPQLVALSHAIAGIYIRNINLPWFVYTGGGYEGEEALRHMIPQQYRNWDEKQWYDKPGEEYELFNAIRKAVENREDSYLMESYPEAFKICGNQELLDVLRRIDTKSFQRDETIPNTIRCLTDKICDYLYENSIYPEQYKTSNKIKECSILFATDIENIHVPIYIQDSFRFLNGYCNAGSHESEKSQSDKRKANQVRKDIKSGDAKYLNRSAFHSLMNIILWTTLFPVEDIELMKKVNIFFYDKKKELDKKNSEKRIKK